MKSLEQNNYNLTWSRKRKLGLCSVLVFIGGPEMYGHHLHTSLNGFENVKITMKIHVHSDQEEVSSSPN